MHLNYTMHTFNINAYQSSCIHTRLCMKTDREWLENVMADAVADMLWERMNRHPPDRIMEKNLHGCMSPAEGCGITDKSTGILQ
jgi:hypothetical protein